MPKTLPPFVIKEAKDGIIKLTDVPAEGATAQISPEILDEPTQVPFFVQVSLEGTLIGDRYMGTTPHPGTIEINVSRQDLLNHRSTARQVFLLIEFWRKCV
ncbi:hypothetical protein HU765_14720 [Pseudomonas sp. SWRI81]|uniref:hypothetical protein n=1 Tax=Pseudomonas sp. SWRI81 TaxID=2745505 RepID=UPI0016486B86|nr:hypothetical protein [Pseudomonas sp. SWRI81]MBC3271193.1 hypothetical protein [Pseudomonas sp. SWRI81]